MTATQSNLSLPAFGYDLVVATTQRTINAKLREFLSSHDGKEISAFYAWDEKANGATPADESALRAAAGVDPFTIPDGSNQANGAVTALNKAGFEFAFKAKLGAAGLAPAAIPPVIKMDRGSSTVTYQLFFAEFAVLALSERRGHITWTNLKQPAGAPWVFSFTVDLDLRTGEGTPFGKLPEEAQGRLKNLDPSTTFSLRQLYLDLNTAHLQDAPAISGLDPASNAAVLLTRTFLNTYWKTVKASGEEGVLLGYTLKPTTVDPAQPSLIPTDLTIEVSEYTDANGKPTQDYDAYTLDYLVMSNGAPLPAPQAFPWNWIDKGQQIDFDAVMAIRKSQFGAYLNQILSSPPADPTRVSTLLKDICRIPRVTLTSQGFLGVSLGLDYQSLPDAAEQTYRRVEDSSTKVLTFSYKRSAQDAAEPIGIRCETAVTLNVTSDIFFEKNLIRISSMTWADCYAQVGAISARGAWVKKKIDTAYQISVNGPNLLVTQSQAPTVTDLSEVPNLSDVDRFFSGGALDRMIGDLQSAFRNLDSFLVGYDGAIADILNSGSGWVFPGGKTFVFKDVTFSDNQDLIAHLTYVSPS